MLKLIFQPHSEADVSNLRDIAKWKKAVPHICLIHALKKKHDFKIPHCVTGGQGNAIRSKHLVRLRNLGAGN